MSFVRSSTPIFSEPFARQVLATSSEAASTSTVRTWSWRARAWRTPAGRLLIDRLGTNHVAPLTLGGQINPALAANNIAVIKDTHGKTSHLSGADVEARLLSIR
jgi:hypothetical protein